MNNRMYAIGFVAMALLLLANQGGQVPDSKWTKEEWGAANTAKGIDFLTEEEKNTIAYINLARLYPKKFASVEVEAYSGPERYGGYVSKSPYKRTLLEELAKREAVEALIFDQSCYESAKCFAEESGKAGYVGHSRKSCQSNFFGECCSYGMSTGRDVALQLLIDHDVPSLGHRKICLDKSYGRVAVSMHDHAKYDICAVVDFK